ncbi:radical SAM family RiPP maturation amino acid epimerase [Synechococcus sp. KORDI-52]|uniref:radical SAM family RiPP maturation amino acid epimerase n=1 Tax=Synechococcus sp. KORDI-52 TaxID=585425 RepID=UPI0008FF859A|nr:radical SAM family RiPP maturation amino acid epimerase [Synechococcus sp. KORDI-52]
MTSKTQPWEVKRFLELFTADPEFREKAVQSPNNIISRYGIQLVPSEIQDLWQESQSRLFDRRTDTSINYTNWCTKRRQNAYHWLQKLDTDLPSSFRHWRNRQANRYAGQAADGFARRKRLLPFAIELSEGCSIGCQYCGLSAPKLKSVARYERNNNGTIFNSIIQSLKNYIGEAGATGFLYWATDPFDNPDYEKYIQSFNREFGIPPQTTTAAWVKNIDRTRQFIELRETMGGTWDRLSINSLKELHIIMQEFSAIELKDIDLVLQNPESLKTKSCAGRAKDLSINTQLGSIACVSGFLINLSQRNIKLISPCIDFERWPQGYAVYAETELDDPIKQIQEFFEHCEKTIFNESLDIEKILSLREEIYITNHEGQLNLKTQYANIIVKDKIEKEIVSRINGTLSVSEIVSEISKTNEINPGLVLHAANTLYEKGIFEKLPNPPLLQYA